MVIWAVHTKCDDPNHGVSIRAPKISTTNTIAPVINAVPYKNHDGGPEGPLPLNSCFTGTRISTVSGPGNASPKFRSS